MLEPFLLDLAAKMKLLIPIGADRSATPSFREIPVAWPSTDSPGGIISLQSLPKDRVLIRFIPPVTQNKEVLTKFDVFWALVGQELVNFGFLPSAPKERLGFQRPEN
ncbi:MAG: hypothetical protein C4534_08135 [Gaiellales bacterium]|nr:MAG: hypothetical protein C4534_08135 [Gaiellales bacterium]